MSSCFGDLTNFTGGFRSPDISFSGEHHHRSQLFIAANTFVALQTAYVFETRVESPYLQIGWRFFP